MSNNCEKCHLFDNAKFLHHSATKDAGMCMKFIEITFKRDTCKFFLPKQELTENEIFVPLVDVTQLPPITQLNLFQ